jgi:hypothetical protein
MIIAKQKKQENLAEYILYMWQIEDLLRAYYFNMSEIRAHLINAYKVDDETHKEIIEWYQGLIQQMKDEGIQEKGHLQSVINQMNDLDDFHLDLLKKEDETVYHEVYDLAKSNIELFRKKSKLPSAHDVEVCLNALYSLLMLRLQKRSITKETENAMISFSNLLGLLSQKYLAYHRGEEDA